MAEKIGFMSFSAFDLRKATEFEAIRRNTYDTKHPTQSFFDHHPVNPPWNATAHIGNEPMQRKTPAEFLPLMNEYHRYFYENAVQHEAYLRWVRRHRAWDRETEVFFGRFNDLRDRLNDLYAAQDYVRRGRMHQIYDKATQRTWLNTELLETASANEAMEQKIRNAKTLQKKLEAQALYQQRAFEVPDERQAWKKREEASRVAPTTHENRVPLNVNVESPWVQALAISHYQQQIQQMPIAQAALHTQTGTALQSSQAAPIVKKVNGLG